ncbi:MAG: MAPEG family protein [Leptospira sp.]|nr:MAPEG family protein [Leptospira sp.]NCS94465.1 MAPEG family protein [Leptospira sp.]
MLLTPLFIYLGITIFLILVLLGFRSAKVIMGTKRSNEFPSWEKHGSGFYWRLNRAQINCLDNLPIYASLVILGYLIQIQDSNFGILAWIVILGRVIQIFSHLLGETVWHVNFRFTGYIIQILSFAGMLYYLIKV